MKYRSSKDIRLGDEVTYRLGGLALSAHVVSIGPKRQAVEGYEWALDQYPNAIGLLWKDRHAASQVFWPSNPEKVAPVFFTDVDDEDLLLVARAGGSASAT